MTMRYAVPEGTLHWRRWDDEEEMVVFDTASGNTHLLSPVAAEVLLALLEVPCPQDAAQLAQRLLPGEDGAPPDVQDVRALQAVLANLARLDLVIGCDGTSP